MKKYILLLIIPFLSFGQSNSTKDIVKLVKQERGLQFRTSPGVSYFGNSIKTHWEIATGWMSKDGIGINVGLEGIFDSQSFDRNLSSYNQQSAFINLEFIFTDIWNNDATRSALSFGWLIKDDANIFHRGGNVDCFRVMTGTTLAKHIYVYGAFYFDKDGNTGKRHDLPAVGIRMSWD